MRKANCPECLRTFDLTDAADAAEWSAGHDCEPVDRENDLLAYCDDCETHIPYRERDDHECRRYEGWANYDTWNVMLWINNEYETQKALEAWIRAKIRKPVDRSYSNLIATLGLGDSETGDGVSYLSETLNYHELDAHLIEMIEETKQYI